MRPSLRGIGPLLLSIFALLAPSALRANVDDAAFDEGVALTRDGHYAPALDRFLRAEAAGDRSARLAFNLGVVHYRLGQYPEARASFERAAADSEMHDLAQYNLGLVALAAGDRERAERWFRLTAERAQEAALRGLAARAMTEALGLDPPAPRTNRGSLAVLRGEDSNVLIPVGAIADLPSSRRDPFWEARAGWADTLGTAAPDLHYRLAGLAIEYDEIGEADIAAAEAGLDWRGPITIEGAVGVLLVGDRSYQRSLDLRTQLPVWDDDWIRLSLDGHYTRVDPSSLRAQDLEGSQQGVGFSTDVAGARWALNLAYRFVDNDRRAAALSPRQQRWSLRLRCVMGRVAARAWTRYTDSDYPTGRDDQATEFGADLGLRLAQRWEWLVEATWLDNQSDQPGFEYDTHRLYTGLRVRY